MAKYNQVSPSELSKLHTLIRTYHWKGDASNLEPNLGYIIGKFEQLKSLEAQRAKTDEQHKKLVYSLNKTDKIAAVKAILPKQAYQQPLAFLNLQQQNEANNNFAAFQ
ncbi:unnamed protein product [Vitrella brassicaformis CCMP3155]|uniref:Uncharacterized protein n=1 Tax=Vitrella brassicaformis (strain CCMP3155) TaxID=1169540 RepID=A0A0G4GFQ3_VITBC|nr:unnamed protein product [Vitrella brassicaformis CCMP3155]|eukprot:CEM28343.1 unnamed protein product [Vitrella brassicaformis CCMP3155]